MPLDRFTIGELAIAADIPWRSLEHIAKDRRILRPAVDVGRSSARYYGVRELARVAMIAALEATGQGIGVASSLAAAWEDKFVDEHDYLVPANLTPFLRKPFNQEGPDEPWWNPWSSPIWSDSVFWFHHNLRTRTRFYRAGKALGDDSLVEIVDHRYVFAYSRGERARFLSPETRRSALDGGCFRIIERDGGAAIVPIFADFRWPNTDFSDPEVRRLFQAVVREAVRALENAVGVVIINLDLAARNALDRIHDHRINSGDPRMIAQLEEAAAHA